MKLAVVGSRDYPNLSQVRRYVMAQPPGTVIVSGGARGVDREAEIAAYLMGFGVVILPANWKKHGNRAGFVRNFDIVREADAVVAFWDGRSNGTAHTITVARAENKLREVFVCRRKPKGVAPNDGKFQKLPPEINGLKKS